MKFLLALLGAAVGAAMGGPIGAVAGLIGGWVFATMLKNGERKTEPPVAAGASSQADALAQPKRLEALDRRVAALEQEVAQLRSQLRDAVQGKLAPAELESELEVELPPLAAGAAEAAAIAPRAPESAESLGAALVEAAAALDMAGDAKADVALPQAVVEAAEPALATAAAPVPLPPAVPLSDSASVAPAPKAPAAAEPRPPRPPLPPPPPPVPLRDRLPPFLSRWIFGGNTIVKVGVLILFLGLAFLLRYAAEQVTLPIELRYAGVAAMGAALLALGWRLRGKADASGGQGYGLILQGAGVGVFYLTALSAIKLHPLLEPAVAFAFMAMVSVLGAVLAVAQNAPWLALVSVAEGFAAPVLASTGSGNHVALFSYLAILDVGIFLMAWFRAWRPLNLVGFVGTFTLAGGWAHAHYTPVAYPSVQAFLLFFFALFTFIGVLFARRALALAGEPEAGKPLSARAAEALRQVGRVDSTLAFGVPLAAFGFQYLLVRSDDMGPAWSAFGFALFYLLLGGALLRGPRRYALLGEAYVIVSAIFTTLTVPLALEGVWTGATWAVEAAGMYWLGTRQHRPYARAFAQAVLAAAAARLVTSLTPDFRPEVPLISGSVLGMALLAASAFAMHLVHRRAPETEHPAWERLSAFAFPWLAIAAFDAIAWMIFIPLWASAATAWLAFGCALVQSRWRVPALQACVVALHALSLVGLVSTLHTADGAAMLADGWLGLVAAVLIGGALLASAWLGLRATLRAAAARGAAPAWSLASSLGLLAGLAVLNGSLLFVMPAEQAALVWPWVGLAALWLGLRIVHPALALAWMGLQGASGVVVCALDWPQWIATWPAGVMALGTWTSLVLAATGFVAGDWLQKAQGRTHRWPVAWAQPAAVHVAVLGWALLWWAQVAPPEVYRRLAHGHALQLWPALAATWVLATSVLMTLGARWRAWRMLGQATAGTVPLLAALALLGPLSSSLPPSSDFGWLVWPLALLWHAALLRSQQAWLPQRVLQGLHVLGYWLFVLLAARESQLAMAVPGEPGSTWSALGWVLVPAIVMAAITRPALRQRWPLSRFGDVYFSVACTPLALYLLLWFWGALGLAGNASPLPYVPLLNPLELGQGWVLLSLVLWQRALPAGSAVRAPRPALLGVLGLSAFALYTAVVLRTCHHWAGVRWDGQALFDSTLTQAALSVAWSAIGVALMLLGHRRVLRVVWLAGAALLAVVVAKLFLVELADRGSLYRIVSFIVVGLLLLLVGYFAPVPPKRGEDKTA